MISKIGLVFSTPFINLSSRVYKKFSIKKIFQQLIMRKINKKQLKLLSKIIWIIIIGILLQ